MIHFSALGEAFVVFGVVWWRAQTIFGTFRTTTIGFHDGFLAEYRGTLFRLAHDHSTVASALGTGTHLPRFTFHSKDAIGCVTNGSIIQ